MPASCYARLGVSTRMLSMRSADSLFTTRAAKLAPVTFLDHSSPPLLSCQISLQL